MTPSNTQGTILFVFEEELDELRKVLKDHVIRMAALDKPPYYPLRPNKEIEYDVSGEIVQANTDIGISLAASIEQLNMVWKPGRVNVLLAVPRTSSMPPGFRMRGEDPHHWYITTHTPMSRKTYIEGIEKIISDWKRLGLYVRYKGTY